MTLPLFVIDAFTAKPFAGNPAAVCLMKGPAEAGWMQQVAREMNLSETAFLHPQGDGFGLRWFTPTVEVDLCGHATLASAHFLWEKEVLQPDRAARFHTRSGLLTVRRQGGFLEMDFPAKPAEKAEAPPGLEATLGATARFVGRNQFDYLVEVESARVLRALNPDHDRLATLPVRGVIVTAAGDTPEYDFVSRFFAPGSGIREDPVTGSAHCCLAPYWHNRLGKDEMTGYQASARGGVVGVRVTGARVLLRGQAVTVVRGELVA